MGRISRRVDPIAGLLRTRRRHVLPSKFVRVRVDSPSPQHEPSRAECISYIEIPEVALAVHKFPVPSKGSTHSAPFGLAPHRQGLAPERHFLACTGASSKRIPATRHTSAASMA